MKTAQALFDDGIRLFNQARFEQACPKFEQSLNLVHGVGTRGKLAECWERIGRTASAYRLYLEVERLALDQQDTLRAQIARQRAERLKPAIPRLIIDPGPSVTLAGFRVTCNGEPVAPRTFKTEQFVDPGEYIVAATAPGHTVWRASLRVAPAQSKQVDVPSLLSSSAAPQDGPSRPWNADRIAAAGLAGAGAISLLGGTTFFALRARSKWSEARDRDQECAEENGELACVTGSQGETLANQAVSSANWANVSAGLGILAVSTGAFLWWRARAKDAVEGQKSAGLMPTIASPSASGATIELTPGLIFWQRF